MNTNYAKESFFKDKFYYDNELLQKKTCEKMWVFLRKEKSADYVKKLEKGFLNTVVIRFLSIRFLSYSIFVIFDFCQVQK